MIAFLGCVVMAASLAGVGVESGGARAEAIAWSSGTAAQGPAASPRIYVKMRTGWIGFQNSFDIVVTDASGRTVEGRSALDGSGVLSFTPAGLMDQGVYGVEVRQKQSAAEQGDVLESWSITVNSAPSLTDGAGGSVLLVAQDGTRDAYLAEILRAEGVTGFHTVTPEQVSSELLTEHTVVLLGAEASAVAVPALEPWVLGGGDLITMKPEGRLAELAGLGLTGQHLRDGYLAIDTTQSPGAGLTAETMQFMGDAHLYTAQGNRSVATLSADGASALPYPALTLAEVGTTGGHIAAFSYDLATTVMYTRQGNPDAAGTERDGSAPIRPNDMFTGADDEPAALDSSKIGIPQADEQMRLLSNMLVELHSETSPLPRFWYLPNGRKAALVMTADDHGTINGTQRSFDRMLALAEPGCDVELWECPRATSWLSLSPTPPLSEVEAQRYTNFGFGLGAHVSTDCEDWTVDSLHGAFASSMLEFRTRYPTLPAQVGNRLHCVAYSDWLSLPTEETQWGIRLDMNFYNWPPGWIRDQAGYITGSALPMRFSDESGQLLDVFQQETHLVNETWNGSTSAIEELLSAAEDERGYYGAFGTHYDFSDDFDQQLMDIATRRGVPMISAAQLVDFTDGRQASSFINVTQSESGDMTFQVAVDPRASGKLTAMLPVNSGGTALTALTAGGAAIDYDIEILKGIPYALFTAENVSYTASYR
jgi:hypothetical protein